MYLTKLDVESLHSKQQQSASKLSRERLGFQWEHVPHPNCSTNVGAPLKLTLDSA